MSVSNEELQVSNEELFTANENLHTSNTQLTRTNAELNAFVYTASHDLETPITNIEGLVDALQEKLPADTAQDDMVTHLLHLMQDSVTYFQQTLSHLTDLAQVQPAGPTPHERIDLGALIEQVRLDLAPTFEATKGQLRVNLLNGIQLLGSSKDLRSIVFNLVSNGLKYRHRDRPPVVQLSAYCTRQQLVLSVQGNGLGMTTVQLNSIFKLFKRLHPPAEGSRVGLYAIKKLIDIADGTIEVTSEPGVGSTFTVRLPL